MKVYLVRRRQMTRSGLLFGLFVAAFVLGVQARGIERRLLGVRPGVILEGRVVGGLLPEELTSIVRQISGRYEKEAENAMYFSEVGQVIPEKSGVCVDVAGSVRAVFAAKPGTRVDLITRVVPAAITKDYFTPVFRGPADRPDVALAINVAWGEESLPGLLDVFGKEDVRATFFFIGDWARKFPELVQAVAADGHEVGNHGLYHGHPCALSREDLSRMILENNVLLAKIIGRQPSPLFAPPAGEFNQRSVGVAADLGYRTILWTVDTIDWKRPSPDLIHARVVNKVLNGAIILMHPTAPTLVALPGLIKALREKGFRFVTVGEMLGRH